MSSSSDEAAKAAAVAADEAPVAPEVRADETEASPPAVSEVAASETAQEPQNEAEKPTTDAKKDADENEKPSNDGEKPADNDGMTADGTPEANAPKKRGRKRNVSVAEETKPAVEKNANGEATKDDGDAADEKKKQPVVKKPKTAPSTPVKVKRKPGRPRKHPKPEESDDDESIEDKMDKKVASLPEDIKAKFGTIVWAKMVGFPYWPALITDPRRLHPRVQESALKELDTKFFVCFYQTRDFYPVLFKNVESWDDSKHDYRSGHPSKDAKAPKRRNNLMSAITEADKDVALPVEERMEGLLKMVDEPESSKEEEVEKPVKRKPGRPLGSKNKKTLEAAAAAAAAAGSGGAPSPAPKAKRGRKKSDATDPGDEQQDKPTKTQTQEEEEEEASTPLSKEEIKAKVASRKTPSKKKPASAEDKAAAAVKKVPKSSSKSEPSSKAELDSKRKKEIELVVPRKSVKSADIREATEEAARKKVGAKEKPKDKGVYKVGNLAQFASKMTRLQANESSKNNDELIQMLTKLFEEKMVYRSDVERSGVAAIIAVLRKSSNPTVAKTASAVRKHLVRVLNTDTETSSKKNKADGEADAKPSKKLKTTDAAPESTPEATPEPNEIKSEEDLSKSPSTADLASVDEDVGPGKATDREPDKSNAEVSIKSETLEKPTPSTEEPTPSTEEPVKTQETITSKEPAKVEASVKSDENDAPVASEKPSPAVKTDATPVATPTASSTPRPDPSGDKGRMTCIDMLKKALAPIGEKSADIAREIEEQVYERFSDSSEEYRACARSITFGLKKNAKVRERLSNGSLHALELAYSHEQILKEA